MKISKIIFIILIIIISVNSINANDIYFHKHYKISNVDTLVPKVALVLSGGGARGISQIGVLKEFEKNNIPINYIVGTSIGSIVGGLYSVGYSSTELDSIIRNTNWQETMNLSNNQIRSDLFLDQKLISDRSLLSLRFKNFNFVVPEAISLGVKLESFLQKLFWNAIYQTTNSFDSLKYPFRAVSTDLISGKKISLDKGNIITAIRSSATVPLRYTPVKYNNMLLVDGGVIGNIPVQSAMQLNPDLIIAVNTTSPLLDSNQLNNPWNIADQVISIAMAEVSNYSMNQIDFEIIPRIENHKNTDFNNIDFLIEEGIKSSQLLINQIKHKIDSISLSTFHNLYLNRIKNEINDFSGYSIEFLNFDSFTLNKFDFILSNNKNVNYHRIKEIFEEIYVLLLKNSIKEVEVDINITEAKIIVNAINYIKITEIQIENNGDIFNKITEDLNINFKDSDLSILNQRNIIEFALKKLREAGFSYTDLSNKTIENNILKLKFNERKIRKIIQKSKDNTNSILISRDLEFSVGELVNADKIIKSWNKLIASDLFKFVQITPIKNDDGTSDIIIESEEIGSQSIKIGARVDNERNLQANLFLIEDNLFESGARLSALLGGGEFNQLLSLKYENTRILSTDITTFFEGIYKYREVYEYKPIFTPNIDRFQNLRKINLAEQGYGIKVGFGSQIERSGRIGIDFRYELQRNFYLDSIPPDFYKVNTVSLTAKWDNEDQSDFPTTGRTIYLNLETNLLNLSESVSFSKAEIALKMNSSFGNYTLSRGLRFGAADITLPVMEFFSLGGEDNFLGLREDEYRGRQILTGFLELRTKLNYNLLFDTYISIRYNIGSTWELPENIRISTLKHGLGLFAAFDTPLGPAKFGAGKAYYFLKEPFTVVWGEMHYYFSFGLKI